jgi:hypothetical protein
MSRFTSVVVGAVAMLAPTLGPATGQASAAAGGLSVSPAIVEHAARAGGVGTITIANTTSAALTVNVSVRPWVQSRTGAVAPNPRRTLGDIRLSRSSFTLGAGARQTVSLTLLGAPAGGSLYGSIQVLGTPQRVSVRTGISVAYRLISTLRLDAAHKLLKLQVANAAVTGEGAHRVLALNVRNAGNTVDPITGSVRLQGPRGTVNENIAAARILPGATVQLPPASLRGVPAGSYTASIALVQDGRRVLDTTRRIIVP